MLYCRASSKSFLKFRTFEKLLLYCSSQQFKYSLLNPKGHLSNFKNITQTVLANVLILARQLISKGSYQLNTRNGRETLFIWQLITIESESTIKWHKTFQMKRLGRVTNEKLLNTKGEQFSLSTGIIWSQKPSAVSSVLFKLWNNSIYSSPFPNEIVLICYIWPIRHNEKANNTKNGPSWQKSQLFNLNCRNLGGKKGLGKR